MLVFIFVLNRTLSLTFCPVVAYFYKGNLVDCVVNIIYKY